MWTGDLSCTREKEWSKKLKPHAQNPVETEQTTRGCFLVRMLITQQRSFYSPLLPAAIWYGQRHSYE